jgi:hypothetical protein
LGDNVHSEAFQRKEAIFQHTLYTNISTVDTRDPNHACTQTEKKKLKGLAEESLETAYNMHALVS